MPAITKETIQHQNSTRFLMPYQSISVSPGIGLLSPN